MASNAERQRRYRRHRAGDHTLCDSARDCRNAEEPVTRPVTPPAAHEPGERGRRLWREECGDSLTGGRRALLEEACRIADRLDRLDAVLSGSAEDWLGFVETKGNPERQEVVIDKPLAEARQQATALKQIIAELRQGASEEKPATGGSVLDQLAAKRSQRLANPAG